MTVFSDWSRSQTIDIGSCYLSKHLLKTDRGNMMTFIDYHHAVIFDKWLCFAIT